jgi:hypothetical protein
LSTETRTKPNLIEYITYSYGRTLPPSMREWVRHDLAGKGSATRLVVRVTIPCILLLLPLLLIPTTLYVYISMTVPILIPFVYFAIALNRVYRRHRLSQHGLDPALVDEQDKVKNAVEYQAYRDRHGHT